MNFVGRVGETFLEADKEERYMNGMVGSSDGTDGRHRGYNLKVMYLAGF